MRENITYPQHFMLRNDIQHFNKLRYYSCIMLVIQPAKREVGNFGIVLANTVEKHIREIFKINLQPVLFPLY